MTPTEERRRQRQRQRRTAERERAATSAVARRAPIPARTPAAEKAVPAGPRISRWRVVAIAFVLLALGLSVAGCSVYSSVSKDLPDPTKQLHGSDQTSRIYDRDGKLLADLYAEQNRRSVKLAQIPKALQQAVIATEDERYYQHAGVDPVGLMRAVVTDVVRGKKAQGGSTITQQYVKNAFTNQENTLKRKVMEAMLAYRVEKRFSKDRILEMYLNTIYFGHGAYGVERAAEVYFGKPVEKLDVAECAMLAGVIKSPYRYSPHNDTAAAKLRRHTVLAQMRDQGYLDASTYAAADAEGFKLGKLTKSSVVAPYFVEYVKNTLVERFGADAVYRGGLSVKTTLDLDMQHAAEKAVAETLDRKGDPSAAVVAVDPKTGEVRAMVGGSDFGSQQYNVAVQGHRQPGSAFKPFVLAAALKQGVSPEETFESGPVELTPEGATTPWKVTGAGEDRNGPMRLREATERSVNSVFAQLILQIGADKVVAAAKDLGVVTPVTPVPAIALGGLEQGVSPLEMASAYATLADGGVKVPAHGIAEVKDAKGKLLFAPDVTPKRVLSAQIAYLTTDILKGVIEHGTGTEADIDRPAAGKTGTTQAYRDAWFCGYTPQLAASVWVGYPDAAKEMTSVHGRKVTGGSFPAEIWRKFMTAALDGTDEKDFTEPKDGLAHETVCLDTGKLATEYCPRTADGLFLEDAVPGRCTVHRGPEKVEVPDVVGMTRSEAETALKNAGFVPVAGSGETSGSAGGTVTSQDPPAGTKAARGSKVTLRFRGSQGSVTAPAVRASFTYEAQGLTVSFDAGDSEGPAALKYEWDFGDGTTGEGPSVSHTFGAKGTYEVRLRVSGGNAADSVTQRLKIKTS